MVRLAGTVTSEAVRTGSGLILQGEITEMHDRFPNLVLADMRSVILAPLLYENEIIGVLNLRARDENVYSDHHLSILTRVAAAISLAINE